jgi:hypothetical protein
MVQKYRKKPVTIEAVRWDGDNIGEINDFVKRNCAVYDWKINKLVIATLEGEMVASEGDYIICGVQGEYYPCKPNIFEATYEPVTQ